MAADVGPRKLSAVYTTAASPSEVAAESAKVTFDTRGDGEGDRTMRVVIASARELG